MSTRFSSSRISHYVSFSQMLSFVHDQAILLKPRRSWTQFQRMWEGLARCTWNPGSLHNLMALMMTNNALHQMPVWLRLKLSSHSWLERACSQCIIVQRFILRLVSSRLGNENEYFRSWVNNTFGNGTNMSGFSYSFFLGFASLFIVCFSIYLIIRWSRQHNKQLYQPPTKTADQ